MEDPVILALRLSETAKDIADEARALANEAINQSAAVETYSAEKFLATFTKSVDLAVKGGLQLARDVLDQPGGPPDPNEHGRRQVADVMETISRRMIRQAGAVARETADKVEGQPNSPNLWVRSMVKLANISLLGSIELAETVLIGPAKDEAPLTLSDDFDAPGAVARKLQLKTPEDDAQAKIDPGGLHRPGTSDPIPAELVTFYEATAVGVAKLPQNGLALGQNKFRIGVDPRPLVSGIYVGTVQVLDAGNNVIGTVPVEIAI